MRILRAPDLPAGPDCFRRYQPRTTVQRKNLRVDRLASHPRHDSRRSPGRSPANLSGGISAPAAAEGAEAAVRTKRSGAKRRGSCRTGGSGEGHEWKDV